MVHNYSNNKQILENLRNHLTTLKNEEYPHRNTREVEITMYIKGPYNEYKVQDAIVGLMTQG